MKKSKNKKGRRLWVLALCIPFFGLAQLQSYSISQLDSLQNSESRPVVVFIQTSWCHYCQLMKNTTLKNDKIIQELNDQFWFVQLDAEEKQTLVFRGRRFRFKPTGNGTGINTLALALGQMDGRMAYPSLYILNSRHEIIFRYNQFLLAQDFLAVLHAFVPN